MFAENSHFNLVFILLFCDFHMISDPGVLIYCRKLKELYKATNVATVKHQTLNQFTTDQKKFRKYPEFRLIFYFQKKFLDASDFLIS